MLENHIKPRKYVYVAVVLFFRVDYPLATLYFANTAEVSFSFVISHFTYKCLALV